MDSQLDQLIDLPTGQRFLQLRIDLLDPVTGEISLNTAQGPRTYTLKPIGALYGPGVGAETVDPQNPDYALLFLAIEQCIVRCWKDDPSLTDASVQLALDRVALNPEDGSHNDALARQLQFNLRLLLSLHDYSRQDVRSALRKIGKSVSRHTRLAGPRGYLQFIREYVPV